MTDNDFHKLTEFKVIENALIPVNEIARDLIDHNKGKTISLKEMTSRDLSYHRAYFSLINYIYSWLPERFKRVVPECHFYKWLKHLQGHFDELYRFNDGTILVEYQSISFGRMSQVKFVDYVKNQLGYIYEYVIREICDEPEIVIENIEFEFENFISCL